MPDGGSLYDLFGFEWTLLRLRKARRGSAPVSPMLKVLDLESEEARELYGADFVLIRPDQVVAWRSNSGTEVEVILRKLCGFLPRAPGPANLT
jgi:hypothetical protein